MAQDRRLVQGRVVRRTPSLTVALVLGGLAALMLLFLTDNATRGIAAAGEPEVASAIAESPPIPPIYPSLRADTTQVTSRRSGSGCRISILGSRS